MAGGPLLHQQCISTCACVPQGDAKHDLQCLLLGSPTSHAHARPQLNAQLAQLHWHTTQFLQQPSLCIVTNATQKLSACQQADTT